MKRYILVLSESQFKYVYFETRYDNIHRLMKNGRNPPKTYLWRGAIVHKAMVFKEEN